MPIFYDTKACPRCGGSGKVSPQNGGRLRLYRESKRVSLRKMAKMLGISPMYLSQIERGLKPFPDKYVGKYQDL